MKVLKAFASTIICIVLFALLISLVFISESNKIVSSDTLKDVVNELRDDSLNNNKGLSKSMNKLIDNIYKNQEMKDIMTLYLDNYKEYKKNKDFRLSSEDYHKVYNFLYKFRDKFDEYDLNGQSFEEYFNEETVNERVIEGFEHTDELLNSKALDRFIDGYLLATSYLAKHTIVFVIILFLVILSIINWSPIKWMVQFGIVLILSGIIVNLFYHATNIFNLALIGDRIDIRIDFSGFLITSIIQIVLGVILVGAYIFIKNKNYFEKKEDITEL